MGLILEVPHDPAQDLTNPEIRERLTRLILEDLSSKLDELQAIGAVTRPRFAGNLTQHSNLELTASLVPR